MLSILAVCTVMNFFYSDATFEKVANGFIPSIPNSTAFVSVIGAVIMPQNIFLHSSLVQTRKHIKLEKSEFVNIFRVETAIILFASFLINLSLAGVFASDKFKDIVITLENAGGYLKEFLSDISEYLWGLGLIASGISSTATGALTGQYLMDGIFVFKINKKLRIILTRLITILPCFLIINYTNDITNIMSLLNIVQVVSLPFVIIPLIKFATSQPTLNGYIYSSSKIVFMVGLALFLQVANY